MPSIYSENKIRKEQGLKLICGCGAGYVSNYDGKCGHCRTRKEKREYERLVRQKELSKCQSGLTS